MDSSKFIFRLPSNAQNAEQKSQTGECKGRVCFLFEMKFMCPIKLFEYIKIKIENPNTHTFLLCRISQV